MKKVLVFCFLTLFLISLAFAAQENSNGNQAGTANAVSNSAKIYCTESDYKYENGTCKFKDNTECDAEKFYDGECGKEKVIYKSEGQKQKENSEKIKTNAIKEKNRLKIKEANASECPNNCTCSGSTTKCFLNGGREMTIEAGKSGNIIVQIKGENMTTNVTLYKAEDGKVYRVKNNETKEVKYLPDAVRERIKEKIMAKTEGYASELDDNGAYHIQIQKKAKFLGLFPVKEKVQVELNSETGEITKTKTSWWGFLAKDEKEELVGASCGTVTPGQNDACCVTKGFSNWNLETSQCEVQ
jgi:hypothetical protein